MNKRKFWLSWCTFLTSFSLVIIMSNTFNPDELLYRFIVLMIGTILIIVMVVSFYFGLITLTEKLEQG